MKIVFIEPNLKSLSGHVYEATKSLIVYTNNLKGRVEFSYVCHQNVDQIVKKELEITEPLYALSCFENKNTADLNKCLGDIISRHNLNKKDAIVYTTAHLRDLQTANSIVQKPNSPRFILQFHQYYPPMSNSDLIHDPKVIKKIEALYKNTFSQINKKRVMVVVTPIKKFAEKIHHVTGYMPQIFPVPFSPPLKTVSKKSSDKHIHIGFYGDGRKEKGLLEFLKIANALTKNERGTAYHFEVQVQNPRGFSRKELTEIKKLLVSLAKRKTVKIINGNLNTLEYYKHLTRCDIACIFHHPDHYSIRLSGIGVECGILDIPVISRKGNSVSKWISQNKLYGEIINDCQTKNVRAAIKKLSQTTHKPKRTNASRELWRKEYSANNYLNNYLLPTLTNNEWK